MDIAFAPPGERWMPVSPVLRRVRRAVLLAVLLPLAIVAALVATLLAPAWVIPVVIVVAAAAVLWGWVLIDRNVRSWRYAERDDDLLISHGVLFRELVVVPYGRMQFVDVKAGPVERRCGIATVQLHTAAASTDARIPGVPFEEAARLRDRLTQLGEARLAGL
jgi:membrane protein YdbS with pleckstrin-like domain